MSYILLTQILDTLAAGGRQRCDSEIFSALNDDTLTASERARLCNHWRLIRRGIDIMVHHIRRTIQKDSELTMEWLKNELEIDEPINGEPV